MIKSPNPFAGLTKEHHLVSREVYRERRLRRPGGVAFTRGL